MQHYLLIEINKQSKFHKNTFYIRNDTTIQTTLTDSRFSESQTRLKSFIKLPHRSEGKFGLKLKVIVSTLNFRLS